MERSFIISKVFEVVVDEVDFEAVSTKTWYCHQRGYAVTGGNDGAIKMHRFIMEKVVGRTLSPSEFIDHIDRNGLNNTRGNLRLATRSQNGANKNKYCGSSAYKGVSWSTKSNKWYAQIRCNKKSYHLGSFSSEIEAAREYDQAAYFFFGPFACVNFPDVPMNCEWHPPVKKKKYPLIGVRMSAVGWVAIGRDVLQHKNYQLGSFRTMEEAALAYDQHTWALTGNGVKLNYPERFVQYG